MSANRSVLAPQILEVDRLHTAGGLGMFQEFTYSRSEYLKRAKHVGVILKETLILQNLICLAF